MKALLDRCAWFNWLLCWLLPLLTTGCASRSFSILDLQTGRWTHVKRQSCRWEVILRLDETNRVFYTMYRPCDAGHLVLRSISYDGRVLSNQALPPFAPEYLRHYDLKWGYAISPNYRSIAYLDEATRELRLFDVATHASQSVLPAVATNVAQILAIEWLSEDRLVVAVNTNEAHTRFLLIDLPTKAVAVELHASRWFARGDVEVCGDYMAFKTDVHGPIQIYDLKHQAYVGEITAESNKSIGSWRWLKGAAPRLVYVENWEEGKNIPRRWVPRLMLYEVERQRSLVLKEWKSEATVYIAEGYGTRVFYWQYQGVRQGRTLWVIDVESGREDKLEGIGEHRGVKIIDSGHLILTQPLR